MSACASRLLLLAFVLQSLAGCALWSLPSMKQPSIADNSGQHSPPPQMKVMTGLLPIGLDQIQPGQYCEFTINGPIAPDTASVALLPVIAGRVVSMDSSDVVLAESVAIDRSAPATHHASQLNKVPYISRLFKSTGIRSNTTQIPGELRLARSSIQHASSIPADQWDTVRDGGFIRIGIDFDVQAESD